MPLLRVNEAEILQNVATTIVERAKIQALSEGVKNAKTALSVGDAASRIIEYSKKRDRHDRHGASRIE